MDIEIEITKDELYRAVKQVGIASFKSFKTTLTYRVLAVLSIMVVIALGVSAFTFVYRSYSYDYFSFLLIFILFVGYTFLFRSITVEFYKYIVYNSKRYNDPIKMRLTDDSIFVQDGPIISQFKWQAFHKAELTKEFMLLYIDIHQAVIIPRKGPETESFIAELKDRMSIAGVHV